MSEKNVVDDLDAYLGQKGMNFKSNAKGIVRYKVNTKFGSKWVKVNSVYRTHNRYSSVENGGWTRFPYGYNPFHVKYIYYANNSPHGNYPGTWYEIK